MYFVFCWRRLKEQISISGGFTFVRADMTLILSNPEVLNPLILQEKILKSLHRVRLMDGLFWCVFPKKGAFTFKQIGNTDFFRLRNFSSTQMTKIRNGGYFYAENWQTIHNCM